MITFLKSQLKNHSHKHAEGMENREYILHAEARHAQQGK